MLGLHALREWQLSKASVPHVPRDTSPIIAITFAHAPSPLHRREGLVFQEFISPHCLLALSPRLVMKKSIANEIHNPISVLNSKECHPMKATMALFVHIQSALPVRYATDLACSIMFAGFQYCQHMSLGS